MINENGFNSDDLKLTSSQVEIFLGKFEKQDLVKHYVFKEDITCVFEESSEVEQFLKENNPITIEIKGGEIYTTPNLLV